PDVDGHEEGFCVKIVEGVLSVWKHSTPSFFTSQGLGSSSTRRDGEPTRERRFPICSLPRLAERYGKELAKGQDWPRPGQATRMSRDACAR
ncbi:hypothetical protein CSW21_05075, partial [Thermus scotoductus]